MAVNVVSIYMSRFMLHLHLGKSHLSKIFSMGRKTIKQHMRLKNCSCGYKQSNQKNKIKIMRTYMCDYTCVICILLFAKNGINTINCIGKSTNRPNGINTINCIGKSTNRPNGINTINCIGKSTNRPILFLLTILFF
jgi:hypothetical protein